MTNDYMAGRWVVCKNRGSHTPLGYLVDGTVRDEMLIDPQGQSLGLLIPLDGSWAVELGACRVGHVLRRAS